MFSSFLLTRVNICISLQAQMDFCSLELFPLFLLTFGSVAHAGFENICSFIIKENLCLLGSSCLSIVLTGLFLNTQRKSKKCESFCELTLLFGNLHQVFKHVGEKVYFCWTRSQWIGIFTICWRTSIKHWWMLSWNLVWKEMTTTKTGKNKSLSEWIFILQYTLRR